MLFSNMISWQERMKPAAKIFRSDPQPCKAGPVACDVIRSSARAALLGLAVLLLFSHTPALADVSMESNGHTTSLDSQSTAPQAPDSSEDKARTFGTPPRQTGDAGEAGDWEELPWGIVPEVYVPWGYGYPHHRPPYPGMKPPGGWHRPPHPGMRPPGNWHRPPHPGVKPPGNWHRPPK